MTKRNASTQNAQPAHPFAFLGPAPYRVIKCEERLWSPMPGVAPRVCTTCDACTQDIRWVYTIEASNGARFCVGCDCAQKAGLTAAECREARRSYVAERAAAEREERVRMSLKQQREANLAEHGVALTDRELVEAQAAGEGAAVAWLRAERKYESKHLGTVKSRIRGLEVRIEKLFVFESAFGPIWLYILKDRAGNQLVVKTSSSIGCMPKNDSDPVERIIETRRNSGRKYARWFKLDATVKDHSIREGMRQTIVQRCKATAITSDWEPLFD